MKKLLAVMLLLPSLAYADLTWQCIFDCRGLLNHPIFRAQTPLGWIVKTVDGGQVRITYVPDVEHEWVIK